MAFAFDWRSPSYGGRLASNDFTAVVLHIGGPSLVWHSQLLELGAGDVHVVTAGTAHQVYDFGTAEGIAVAFLPSALDDARELTAALRCVPSPSRLGMAARVINHGLGIAPADQPHVFTPFFRADKSRTRATGGVGLGLALARRIVGPRRHDRFTSELGHASRFWFVLPVIASSAVGAAPPSG